MLIVDDSITIRAMVASIFESRAGPSVVGVAEDAHRARELVSTLRPDVLTLDLSMPGPDGLVFLEALMRERPLPVVVLSSTTAIGSELAGRALSLGAYACFDKATLIASAERFVRAVRNAAVVTPGRATSRET